MKEETKKAIIAEILDFARVISEKKVEYSLNDLKKAFPFHSLFFSDDALFAFKLQRSIVTRLGMQLYPKIAKIIACDRYSKVHVNYEIKGVILEEKANMIEKIVTELRQGMRRPNIKRELSEIESVKGGKEIERTIIADVFIEDHEEGPLFMEIKSPRPNLDVCAETKKKMLYFRTFFEGEKAQAFIGFPYNPFVFRQKYAHPLSFKYLTSTRKFS
nr:TdeIII family type II restriction endonuclease [Candidatus Freyrarchaeum guaymaensis]